MFWVTTVLRCAAAVVDIIIVKRWNIKMGIDDHVMFVPSEKFMFTLNDNN